MSEAPERMWADRRTCTVDGSGASRLLAMDREFDRGVEYVRADHIEELEAKLAKAVDVLEELIRHTTNCERELTEDLYHVDFCGESEPLANARTTLAELKSNAR